MMIKNKFKIFLNYLTVFIIIVITLYRFRIRVPKEIFENPTLVYYFIYISLIFINIFLFLITYIMYKKYTFDLNEKSFINNFNIKVKSWIDSSYNKVMDYVADIPGIFSIILAKITHYYRKIPLNILKILVYAPRIILLFSLFFDVFYLEKFQYSYYCIYLLLLTIISKTILYVSIEINNRIITECLNSIIIINYDSVKQNLSQELPTNYGDYILSEKNTQFNSVKDVIHVGSLTTTELAHLNFIEEQTKTSLKFHIFIRLIYIFIFSYIIYNYPINLFYIFK